MRCRCTVLLPAAFTPWLVCVIQDYLHCLDLQSYQRSLRGIELSALCMTTGENGDMFKIHTGPGVGERMKACESGSGWAMVTLFPKHSVSALLNSPPQGRLPQLTVEVFNKAKPAYVKKHTSLVESDPHPHPHPFHPSYQERHVLDKHLRTLNLVAESSELEYLRQWLNRRILEERVDNGLWYLLHELEPPSVLYPQTTILECELGCVQYDANGNANLVPLTACFS